MDSAQIMHELGNKTGEAKMLAKVAVILSRQTQHDEARQTYERSVAILREMRDWTDLSITLQGFGALEKDMGKLSDANAHLMEAIKLDRSAGNQVQVANDLSILAQIRSAEGDSLAAKKTFRECIQIYRRIGDREGYAIMLNNLADVYQKSGDLITAQKLYSESVKVGKEVGNQGVTATSMVALGYMYMLQDDLKLARQEFEEGGGIIDRINPADLWPRTALAAVLLEEGRKSDSEALLRQSILNMEMHGQNVNVEVDAKTLLVRVLLEQNKVAEAQNALRGVLELVKKTATPEIQLEVGIAEARVLFASGRVIDA